MQAAVPHARAFLEAVDRGDVRMIWGREHFRFALKPGEPIGIGRERRLQDRDRDLAFELRIDRSIHRRCRPRARPPKYRG
jgi:hypothetical protein